MAGELRPVPQAQRRIQEAARLGFTKCLLPISAGEALQHIKGLEMVVVRSLREALLAALGSNRRGFAAAKSGQPGGGGVAPATRQPGPPPGAGSGFDEFDLGAMDAGLPRLGLGIPPAGGNPFSSLAQCWWASTSEASAVGISWSSQATHLEPSS